MDLTLKVVRDYFSKDLEIFRIQGPFIVLSISMSIAFPLFEKYAKGR